MSSRAFPRVAAILETPLLIGTTPMPVWTSWLAAAVTGALSVWGFRTRS